MELITSSDDPRLQDIVDEAIVDQNYEGRGCAHRNHFFVIRLLVNSLGKALVELERHRSKS